MGSVVPAPEGNRGGWLPCFPRVLTSRMTPSFTRKSSLPKIPHAAGKRKKGQSYVGVHVINHLVHKNCLITGKIWKSTYYSEQRTFGAVQEGRASWDVENFRLPPAAEKMPKFFMPPPHSHIITYKATSVQIAGKRHVYLNLLYSFHT